MTRKWLSIRIALICGVGMSALAIPRVTAQRTGVPQAGVQVEMRIRSLSGDLERSPQYDPGGGRDDWYVLRTVYDTATDWIDELTFTYYVLFRPDARKAMIRLDPAVPYLLLKDSVTYIHVPKDRRHESLMFVHPRLLERYGSVERIAVVVTTPASPEPLDYASDPPAQAGWWLQVQPVEGLLMNRDQSPYGPVLSDEHEMIRPAGRNPR